jgi:methionyl-tRNA formyltransferase
MKITLLCSDPNHPVNGYLLRWLEEHECEHEISLVRSKNELTGCQILFLISCSEIISSTDRAVYKVTLVLHASDLPQGRGWSPHIWQIIGGAEQVILSLLEAEDAVDSGRIWHQIKFPVPKHALWNEINDQLFSSKLKLMDYAVEQFELVTPVSQRTDIEPIYFPKRKPADSRIDPYASIASQFDRIIVCDPERFPAHFELYGHQYKLTLEKIDGIEGK